MDDEQLARTTATILGPWSAAARALEELDRRRAAGEQVEIFDFQNRWIVGPRNAGVPVAPAPAALSCPKCGAHSEADAQNVCHGESCPLPEGEFEDAVREYLGPADGVLASHPDQSKETK